jgi:hypothetical protein
MKRVGFILVLTVFVSFLLSNYNCKSNSETDLNREKAEKVVGIVAKTVSNLLFSLYQGSTGLDIEINKEKKATGFNANYNSNTGWWSVTLDYNGYKANLNIQLKDGNGNIQKNYNCDTEKFYIKGTGTGPEVEFDIDWTLSGVGCDSQSYTVNGTGTMQVSGESVSINLSKTSVKKNGVNLSAGQMSIEVAGIVFELNFDGNSIITVNYSYMGKNYSITINIITGEVN